VEKNIEAFSIRCFTISVIGGQDILLLGDNLHGDHRNVHLLLGDIACHMSLPVISPASLANLTTLDHRAHLLHGCHRVHLRHACHRVHPRQACHRVGVSVATNQRVHLLHTSHTPYDVFSDSYPTLRGHLVHTTQHLRSIYTVDRSQAHWPSKVRTVHPNHPGLHSSLNGCNFFGALLLLLVQCFVNHRIDCLLESSSFFSKFFLPLSLVSLFFCFECCGFLFLCEVLFIRNFYKSYRNSCSFFNRFGSFFYKSYRRCCSFFNRFGSRCKVSLRFYCDHWLDGYRLVLISGSRPMMLKGFRLISPSRRRSMML